MKLNSLLIKSDDMDKSGSDIHTYRRSDKMLLVLTCVATATGLIVLFGLTANNEWRMPYHYLQRQIVFVIAGLVVMLSVSHCNYHLIEKFAYPLFIIATILAVLVLILPSNYGIYGWLHIGGWFYLRVSNISCIAMILIVSHLIGKNKTLGLNVIIFLGIIIAISIGLVMLEPDLSATVTMVFIALSICFIKKPGVCVVLMCLFIAMILSLFLMVDIPSVRMQVWIDPFSDPLGTGYQTVHSLYYIAAGGLWGTGLGAGFPMIYMPDVESGYILSGISYQLGIIGAVIILILLSMIVWRVAYIALRANDSFGFYFAAAICIKFAVAILLNTMVVVNLIPPADYGGLPFVGYGGTGVMLDLSCIGVVLNISKYGIKKPSLATRGGQV